MAKSGRSQGGIIGKVNKTSFGKNKVTNTTATGTFTTQPGTTKLDYVLVAGGGGGGRDSAGLYYLQGPEFEKYASYGHEIRDLSRTDAL